MIDTGLTAYSDEEARDLVVNFIANGLQNELKKKKLKAIKDKVSHYICGVSHESDPSYTGEGCTEYIVHNISDNSLIYVYFNYFDF